MSLIKLINHLFWFNIYWYDTFILILFTIMTRPTCNLWEIFSKYMYMLYSIVNSCHISYTYIPVYNLDSRLNKLELRDVYKISCMRISLYKITLNCSSVQTFEWYRLHSKPKTKLYQLWFISFLTLRKMIIYVMMHLMYFIKLGRGMPSKSSCHIYVLAIDPNNPKWTQMETKMNTNKCNSCNLTVQAIAQIEKISRCAMCCNI